VRKRATELVCTDLMLAAEAGDVVIARSALQRGASPNARTSDCDGSFSDGKAGSLSEGVFESGEMDSEMPPGNNATALMRAIERGHVAVVSLLLDAGASASACDDDGYGPLMCVASSYKAATDTALIDRLIQLASDEAASAEAAKAQEPDAEALQPGAAPPPSAGKAGLCASMGNGLRASTGNGWTACTFAACFGRDVLLRRLIKAGCPADRTTEMAPTPLMKAAQLGHIKSVEYLVTSGKVDLDLVDANSRSALDWAEATDRKDVVDFLRRKGAKRGKQAAMDARAKRETDKREAEKQRDLPRSLSEKGALPTARSAQLLADKGALPKAKSLSDKRGTPNSPSSKSATPAPSP